MNYVLNSQQMKHMIEEKGLILIRSYFKTGHLSMISLSVRASCLFRKVIKGNEFTYSSYNSGVRGVSLPPIPSGSYASSVNFAEEEVSIPFRISLHRFRKLDYC